ncbi:MAG: pyridoxal 5'-phosphate synthase glutaminase subunit PdxT [Anaerolineales bacterium]|nr:pyridoxal 5'-phosphate synthase glutaminase subunit PdxT [Anaerolineales bacterium]
MRIGVLAMQGAFAEHGQALERVGAEPVDVRLPQHLEELDGLIIPGGESTTIGQVAEEWGLIGPIRAFAASGRPVWGTCAGMILMAKQVLDGAPGQPLLRLMDIAARRHAFGRQVDSFETDLAVPVLGEPPYHAVFIRAPLIAQVGEGVDVLAQLDDGRAVAARQGNLLVTAFHPELTADDRFHRYFVSFAPTR